MSLVQALRQRQRGFGGEAKTAVGFFLQGGQVKQGFAAFVAWLAFFGHGGGFPAHRVGHSLRFLQAPDAVFFFLFVFAVFFVLRVKPLGRVSACGRSELGVDFPEIPADKFTDLLFALYHHAQGRRLHATHCCQEEAALPGVKRGQGAGAVDAYEPIGFRAASGGVG